MSTDVLISSVPNGQGDATMEVEPNTEDKGRLEGDTNPHDTGISVDDQGTKDPVNPEDGKAQDILGYLDDIKNLTQRFRGIQRDRGDDSIDLLRELQSIIEESTQPLEKSKTNTATLSDAIEELAEAMTQAIDQVATRLQSETDDKSEPMLSESTSMGTGRRTAHNDDSSSETKRKISPLEKLRQSAKKLAQKIDEAFMVTSKVGKYATTMDGITGDLSSDLTVAGEKSEQLLKNAHAIVSKSRENSRELKNKVVVAERIVNETGDICLACADHVDKNVRSLSGEGEQHSNLLKTTIDASNEFLRDFAKDCDEVDRYLNDGEIYSKTIVRKKLMGLERKLQSLEQHLNDLQSRTNASNTYVKRLKEAKVEANRGILKQVVKSARKAKDDVQSPRQKANKIPSEIRTVENNISEYSSELGKIHKREILQNIKDRIEGNNEKIGSVLFKLDQRIKEAESLQGEKLSDISSICNRLEETTKEVHEGIATFQSAETAYLDVIKSDENTIEAEKILSESQNVGDRLVLVTNNISGKLAEAEMYISEKLATDAQQVTKDSETLTDRMKEETAKMQSTLSSKRWFIKSNAIMTLKQTVKKAENMTERCNVMLKDVKEAVDTMWSFISLPTSNQELCCICLSTRDLETLDGRMTATIEKSKDINDGVTAYHEKLISDVVHLTLEGVSMPYALHPWAFLGLWQSSDINQYLGEIVIKLYKHQTSTWEVFETASPPVKVNRRHNNFVGIKVSQLEKITIAVVQKLRTTTMMVDKHGGMISLPVPGGDISISMSPHMSKQPTKFTVTTFFIDEEKEPPLVSKTNPMAVRLEFHQQTDSGTVGFEVEVPNPPLHVDKSVFPSGNKVKRQIVLERVAYHAWVLIFCESEDDKGTDKKMKFKIKERKIHRVVDYAIIRQRTAKTKDELQMELNSYEINRQKNMTDNERTFEVFLTDIALMELSEEIIEKTEDNIFKLAVHLKIPLPKQDNIQTDYSDNLQERTFRLLISWRNAHSEYGQDFAKMVKELIAAIRKAGYHSVAKRIEIKHDGIVKHQSQNAPLDF